MIVSNSPTLKIGDGVRTPGQPVPEFADWKPAVQRRMFDRRRVVEVTEDVAAQMRERYAKLEEQGIRDRQLARLNDLQREVRTLNRG